jgi:hypothetical protein
VGRGDSWNLHIIRDAVQASKGRPRSVSHSCRPARVVPMCLEKAGLGAHIRPEKERQSAEL